MALSYLLTFKLRIFAENPNMDVLVFLQEKLEVDLAILGRLKSLHNIAATCDYLNSILVSLNLGQAFPSSNISKVEDRSAWEINASNAIQAADSAWRNICNEVQEISLRHSDISNNLLREISGALRKEEITIEYLRETLPHLFLIRDINIYQRFLQFVQSKSQSNKYQVLIEILNKEEVLSWLR
jgi:hypothetical protein